MTIVIPLILVRVYLEILKKIKPQKKRKIATATILTFCTYFIYGGLTNYDNLNRFFLSGLGLTAYMMAGTLICGALVNYGIELYFKKRAN